MEPNETLAEMQRKIRYVSHDIRQYNEEVQTQITAQKKKIEQLRKDNASLREDVHKHSALPETRPASRPNTVLESPDFYNERISEESQRIKELDENIKIIQTKMFDQRKKMGGINASKDTSNALNKQLRILENRLDKANQKFNEAIAHNKQLREQIDNLRRERRIFDSIYQKLEEELQNKRKQMAKIIEEANNAYEDRDKAQDQLAALKQQAEREHLEFEKEWKELNALIERDKKMKDLLQLKQQQRENAEGAAEQQKNEEELNKKKKQAPEQNVIDVVKRFEENFNKIQAATGITDIDQLVDSFIKAEEENFALFKFVNDLSNETESIEKTINTLKAEISNYQDKDEGALLTRAKLDLQEKLQQYADKTEQSQLKYSQAAKVMQKLKTETWEVFQAIECQNYLTYQFLGDGVTESNIEQYLTLIEQRTVEIFQSYAILQVKNEQRDFHVPGPQAPLSSNPTKIEPPQLKDDASDEVDEDIEEGKPWTVDDFKNWAKKASTNTAGQRGSTRPVRLRHRK